MVQRQASANIIGFFKKENPIMITTTNPRIFIGINNGNDIKRVGHRAFIRKNALALEYYFYDIDYDIIFCEIDTRFMEPQDIKFLKNMNFL